MKRRFWCILLTACMVLTLLPFSAFAEIFRLIPWICRSMARLMLPMAGIGSRRRKMACIRSRPAMLACRIVMIYQHEIGSGLSLYKRSRGSQKENRQLNDGRAAFKKAKRITLPEKRLLMKQLRDMRKNARSMSAQEPNMSEILHS